MDLSGFHAYLSEHKISDQEITETIKTIRELEAFLIANKRSINHVTYEDIYRYAKVLIAKKQNTYARFVALYRFGRYNTNKDVIIATLEMLDGAEMIQNFSTRLEQEFGKKLRDAVFKGIGIPPLGIRPTEKVELTKKLVGRFLAKVDYEKCRKFFEEGLRDKYTASYEKPKALFQKVNNMDEFLKQRHHEFVKTLRTHMKDNTLFFTQEVNEEVVAYVEQDQRVGTGIRKGDRVYITKIPYLAKKFIHETDPKKRRYYYCHNPWIREALRHEDQPIDPVFCGCSAGYFKNFWEAVLDHPVRVEVLQSFINGDGICEFALHLPQKYIKNLNTSPTK